MSKKKNKSAVKSVEAVNTVEIVNQSEIIEKIETVDSKRNGLTGIMAYLKAHALMVIIVCFLALGVLGAGLKYLDEDAQRQIQAGYLKGQNKEQSFLNKVNPFLPAPLPDPTPQLSKELIYAGSKLLAVEDANATAASPTDLAIWRPSSGVWWVMNPDGSIQTTQQWGLSADKPVPGDYDGDGKTDFSVYRPDNQSTPENECLNGCNWYVIYSSNNTVQVFTFGLSNDQVASADFDGDGRTDAALYRASNASWYIRRSTDSSFYSFTYGTSSDKPAPADYDGDGRADAGLWRASDSTFYSLNSSDAQYQTYTIPQGGDTVVSGDYDGDGRADCAVYDSTSATWRIRQSTTGQIISPSPQWGIAGDVPVQNDYDSDGKVDLATWRASNGTWHIKNSSNGTTRTQQWGTSGDIPVPANYRR